MIHVTAPLLIAAVFIVLLILSNVPVWRRFKRAPLDLDLIDRERLP